MTRPSRLVLLFALIASAAVIHLRAQQTGTTVTLAGRVTADDANGAPVRRAIVTLTGTGAMASVQLATDDDGRFSFPDLPAGRYMLTAEKPGLVKTFYGSVRPGRGPSAPIALAAGERQSSVAIVLVHGAVVAGTIVDETGAPLSGAQVRVLQPLIVNGERKLVDPPGQLQWVTSDDQGRYRIYGLPPGEYAVLAGGGGGLVGDVRQTTAADLDAATRELQGATAGAAPLASPNQPAAPPIVQRGGTYYPGVADAARAEILTLKAGEERAGVNIRNLLVRAARVEGISVGPTGQPLQNVLVGIANASVGQLWGSPGLIRPGPDGHFVIPALTPGRYILFGRGSTVPGTNVPTTLWTETEITVNEQDLTNVTMQFLSGATVSGRVAFRGSTTPPAVSGVRLTLMAVPTIAGSAVNPPPVTALPDGSFAISGVAPGKYRISVAGAGAWALRSAIAGGQDMLDVPIEVPAGRDVTDLVVTFTDTPAEVAGQLLDRLNRPAPEFSVVLFTVDRALWLTSVRRLIGPVRVASDGTFRFIGVAPGEYYLSTLTEIDPRQLGDPALLEQLAAAAVRVTVGEGERKVQNLRIGG